MDAVGGFPASAPEPVCPEPVARAVMTNRWRWLTYLHWPYDPEVVQGLLPEGLRVDTHDRKAWVGLIPFRMEVALPGLPPVPYLSAFPETNVRTYVVGPDGKPRAYFSSLDASRLPAVLVARSWFGLPYRWAAMRIEREARRVRYTSVRREGTSASSSIEVEVGDPVPAGEMTDLHHFLASRWHLYPAGRRDLVLGRLDHAPWALRSVELVGVRQDLVEAAGLPSPDGEPIARYAPGVGVRIAPPARLGNRER
jgi:uncharacterized protein YqjF (DUF2071 family)